MARPISFAHDQEAPPIPAAQLPRSAAERLAAACLHDAHGGARGAAARVRVVDMTMAEEEEGLMATIVALEDGTDQAALAADRRHSTEA